MIEQEISSVLDKQWGTDGEAQYLVRCTGKRDLEWVPWETEKPPRFPGFPEYNSALLKFEMTWNPSVFDPQGNSGNDKFSHHEPIFDDFGMPAFVCSLSTLPTDVRSKRRNGFICIRRVGDTGVNYRWVHSNRCLAIHQWRENPNLETKEWKVARKMQQESLISPVITALDIDRAALKSKPSRTPVIEFIPRAVKVEEYRVTSLSNASQYRDLMFVRLDGTHFVVGSGPYLRERVIDKFEVQLLGVYTKLQEYITERLDQQKFDFLSIPDDLYKSIDQVYACILLGRNWPAITERLTKTYQFIFTAPLALYFVRECIADRSESTFNAPAFLTCILKEVLRFAPVLLRAEEILAFIRTALEYSIDLNRTSDRFILTLYPSYRETLTILDEAKIPQASCPAAALCSLFLGFTSRQRGQPLVIPLEKAESRQVRRSVLPQGFITLDSKSEADTIEKKLKEVENLPDGLKSEQVQIVRHRREDGGKLVYVVVVSSGKDLGKMSTVDESFLAALNPAGLAEYWEALAPRRSAPAEASLSPPPTNTGNGTVLIDDSKMPCEESVGLHSVPTNIPETEVP